MNSTPIVDVIIPIHDSKRPLERAIRSLLNSGLEVGSELQINVVCHNISAAKIKSKLPTALNEVATFFEFNDGLPSPAGPRAFALEQTSGRYFSFLDSDDTFDPLALAQWVSLADSHDLDAVIPPERHDTGRVIRTPPVRRFRAGNLDGVRDRLSYRTAPLGLIRRTSIQNLDLEFGQDVRNGSDQIFALKLWFDSKRVRFARGLPGYVVGGDAETRVTTEMNPLFTELKATRDLLGTPWFANLPVDARRAIATKFLRIQLFGGIERRLASDIWATETRESAADFLGLLKQVAPGYPRSLSVADLRLCRAIDSRSSTTAEISQLVSNRRAFGHPATILTKNLRHMLLPDAPLRYLAASALH